MYILNLIIQVQIRIYLNCLLAEPVSALFFTLDFRQRVFFYVFFKVFSKKLLTRYYVYVTIKVQSKKRGNNNGIWKKKI